MLLPLLRTLGCLAMLSFFASTASATESPERSAYAFSFKTLMGHDPLPLSQFQGKVVLVVNTASQCGFTKQYAGLQELYDSYQQQGLVVLGVPSNDFGEQEQGDDASIARFCQLHYGVTFPMAAKEIVSGHEAHPFYQWARTRLGFGTAPKWNFHKYLIDRHGQLVNYFHSTTDPQNPRLKEAVEQALNAAP